MFSHRRRDGGPTALERARDITEICALVAAGIWAFYVFVYENHVKPLTLQPDVTFSASMSPAGQRAGLRAIHVQVKTQNVGAVRVRFLAFYIVVLGDKIAPGLTNSGLNVVSPYFGIARTVVVYRYGFLTHTADPSVTADLQLEPGQFGEHDQVFYVPPAAFDRLRLYVVARFTRRTDAEIATALAPGQDNLPAFTGDTDNVETTSSLMTSLSMWEK